MAKHKKKTPEKNEIRITRYAAIAAWAVPAASLIDLIKFIIKRFF